MIKGKNITQVFTDEATFAAEVLGVELTQAQRDLAASLADPGVLILSGRTHGRRAVMGHVAELARARSALDAKGKAP